MKLALLAFLLMIFINSGAQKKSEITFEEMKTFTKGGFESADFDSYLAADGHTYKIGDTLKIGRPSSNKTFAFIQEGSGVMTAPSEARASASGSNTIIKRIYAAGTKKMGFRIYFVGKGVCGICPQYYINVEEAISTNELVGLGMTREKAIAKLKEAKELSDLGIMPKEEYEKLKLELTPIIMRQ